MRHILCLLIAALSIISSSAQSDSAWVSVSIPVVCIREGRGHSTELSSQAVMGTPMLVLEDDGSEWLLLKGPDNYEGYVNVSGLTRLTHRQMTAWRKAPRVVVTALDDSRIYTDTTDLSPRNVVSTLVCSSILEGIPANGRYSFVTTPDGRNGWIETARIASIDQWGNGAFNADDIIDRCYYLMGTPYLWGGCTPKSMDCSGLVRLTYFASGILTLRDASQQFNSGLRLAPEQTDMLRRGDLLFFSNTPDGGITHVALYDCNGTYIHSSGKVRVSRMAEDDADFASRVYRGASRIAGMEDSFGIWRIKNHPWYF